MTAVFAVRHTQTTWNLAERYQGRLEAPLSREGQSQAKLVARTFSGQSVTAVYSSPLQRALELAREIARLADAPLLIDQRLTEIAMGPWEGLYRHEIEARYPELYNQWYLRPDTVRFPGGEDLTEIRARVQAALADMFVRYASGQVVAVTHSVVIQVMAACALGLELRGIHHIRISNGSVSTLCGARAPGSLLSLNVTEAIYRSPLAAAAAQDCVSWKPRRMTA